MSRCSSNGKEFIGKWFGVRPVSDSSSEKEDAEVYLGNELAVYTICHALKGAEILHCSGIGEIPGAAGIVFVLEYSPVRLSHRWCAVARTSPRRLKSAATDALHAHDAVHLDLHGWNMVVPDDETVVVDFDVIMVYNDGRGVREWEDWVLLKAAFEV